MTTYILSSSENTTNNSKGQPGNIRIKRKNVSSPTVIAKAIKSIVAMMAFHMKDITDAPLVMERSKIDVQLQLFEEQMLYQRERETLDCTNQHFLLIIMYVWLF